MLYAYVPDPNSLDWSWPNFTPTELACKCRGRFCGGEYWHDPSFLEALQTLRRRVGQALLITSGHRCDLWNAAVGGAPHSMHKKIAVDISIRGHDRHALLVAAQETGFSGYGLARNFIHLDRRNIPARWFYNGSQSLWQR